MGQVANFGAMTELQGAKRGARAVEWQKIELRSQCETYIRYYVVDDKMQKKKI